MKKTFDAVAYMRRRREELSRAYAGLSAEETEIRPEKALKDDPLWYGPSPKLGLVRAEKSKRISVEGKEVDGMGAGGGAITWIWRQSYVTKSLVWDGRRFLLRDARGGTRWIGRRDDIRALTVTWGLEATIRAFSEEASKRARDS